MLVSSRRLHIPCGTRNGSSMCDKMNINAGGKYEYYLY